MEDVLPNVDFSVGAEPFFNLAAKIQDGGQTVAKN
jgi:hypothetical protein